METRPSYLKSKTGFNENLHNPYPYLITENKINTTNKNLRDLILDNAHIKNTVMEQIQSITIKIEKNAFALHSELINFQANHKSDLEKITERFQLLDNQMNCIITSINNLHSKIDTIGLILDTMPDKSITDFNANVSN